MRRNGKPDCVVQRDTHLVGSLHVKIWQFLSFLFFYLKTVINMLRIKEIKQLVFSRSVFCFVLFFCFLFLSDKCMTCAWLGPLVIQLKYCPVLPWLSKVDYCYYYYCYDWWPLKIWGMEGFVHTIPDSFISIPKRKAIQQSRNTYPTCDSLH